MIILALLALGVNAWTPDNKEEAVVEIKQQWQETETVCAGGQTCTLAVDTTAPYNSVHSGRTWGEIIWKVEISVKRNTAGADHKVTVTVPKAKLYPNRGQDLVTDCTAKDTYNSCTLNPLTVANDPNDEGANSIVAAWPEIAPRATITFSFANTAGADVTVKTKMTGINTGRTTIDDAIWSAKMEGKTYNFRGWTDWYTAREECKKQKATTNVEMCLTSEHSDTERDTVTGLIASKGYPGAWVGQTEGVGLGKWLEVNINGWRWSDGSDSSYMAGWHIPPKSGTPYEAIDTGSINSITHGRVRGARVIAFAGSAMLVVGHCGAQLVNGQWSGMKCRSRWPAVCAPCMAGGSKRLKKSSVCDECRLPINPKYKNSPRTRCYQKSFCRFPRPQPSFETEEVPTNWGKIVGTILGVVIPVACIGYCCFYKKSAPDTLEDEE